MNEKKCPACNGRGKVLDDAKTGKELKKLRENSGVSLRALAGKLGMSHTYLTRLETGFEYCHWTPGLVARYKCEVKKLTRPYHAKVLSEK